MLATSVFFYQLSTNHEFTIQYMSANGMCKCEYTFQGKVVNGSIIIFYCIVYAKETMSNVVKYGQLVLFFSFGDDLVCFSSCR